MTVDPDEREATIAATIENFKSGEFGIQRTTALLVLCGLNAKEIDDLLRPLRTAAFENFKNYKRNP